MSMVNKKRKMLNLTKYRKKMNITEKYYLGYKIASLIGSFFEVIFFMF